MRLTLNERDRRASQGTFAFSTDTPLSRGCNDMDTRLLAHFRFPNMSACCSTGCSTGCGGCGYNCSMPTSIKGRPRMQFNKLFYIPTTNACQQTKYANVLNVGQNQCSTGCCSTGCSTTPCAPKEASSTPCTTGCSTGCGGCSCCSLPTSIKGRPRMQFNKWYHIPGCNPCQQTKNANVLNVGQNQCTTSCNTGCCTTPCAPKVPCPTVPCVPKVPCPTVPCAPQVSCNTGCSTGCCRLPTSRTMPMAGCYPKYTGPGCHPAFGACGASMGYNYGGDCQSGGMRYANCNSCC